MCIFVTDYKSIMAWHITFQIGYILLFNILIDSPVTLILCTSTLSWAVFYLKTVNETTKFNTIVIYYLEDCHHLAPGWGNHSLWKDISLTRKYTSSPSQCSTNSQIKINISVPIMFMFNDVASQISVYESHIFHVYLTS